MNLSDLLSELRLNILHDRSDRSSGNEDYLWSDATLVRYINEAQRRFASRSFVIRDATTAEVINVTLEEGVTEYSLHPSILAVISAKLDSEQGDLARAGHSILNRATRSTDNWDLSLTSLVAPGKPMAFSTDEQVVEDDDSSVSAVSMRVFPEPSADYDGELIKLRVVRKPLDELTVNNLSAVPEIPVDHHLEMLDWAAYLALRIIDVDGGNAKRAAEFAQSFESHVQAARTMVMRKLFAPKPWGFGKGGWSWGA
jgi:hypothetical protein